MVITTLMLFGCAAQQTPEQQEVKEPEASASQPVAAETNEVTTTSEQTDADDSQTEYITITDHTGEEVKVPTEINRIATLSMYPAPSVISMFLGSADKIVGVHPVSMSAAKNGILSKLFPEFLNADTSYMTGDELNIEALMELKPDVVFYTAENKAQKQALENAGLTAVGISPTAWDYDIIKTYDEWINLLSQIFPENNKTEIVSNYSKEIYDMIQERTSTIPEDEKQKALFLFQYDDSAMITSGKNFFGQYWATAAGGKNVAEKMGEENSSAKINIEQVYEWDPDVIYITNFTPTQPDDLYNNAIGGDDWSNVTAVIDERVYKMPLGSYRTYTPGTDTPLTLLWVAKTMYPDLFSDIDLNDEVKKYYKEIYGVELTDDDVNAMYNPTSEAAGGFVNN